MYRLTPSAMNDLSLIWDYTEQQWNTRQAEIYISEIRFAFERLDEQPDRGHACDEIRRGYRQYTNGRHVIFYVKTGEDIVIVRILHQHMDPTRHF